MERTSAEHSPAAVVAAGDIQVEEEVGAGHTLVAEEEVGADRNLVAEGEAGAGRTLAARIHLVVVEVGVARREVQVERRGVRVVARGMELMAHRELPAQQQCRQIRVKLRKL